MLDKSCNIGHCRCEGYVRTHLVVAIFCICRNALNRNCTHCFKQEPVLRPKEALHLSCKSRGHSRSGASVSQQHLCHDLAH